MQNWIKSELEAEWKYCYEERLAILGVVDNPTPEQFVIAASEADALVNKLKQSAQMEQKELL